MLLCNVTEMRGLDVVRGGTGGGAFLLLTAIRRKKKNVMKIEPRMANVLFLASHFDVNASYIKLC